MVCLEERHQVWQLEHELVLAELELEGWDLDELFLFGLVVAVLVGQNASDHGEEGNDKDDLLHRRTGTG